MRDIFDTVGVYDITENEEEEIHDGDIFNSIFALVVMPFFSRKSTRIWQIRLRILVQVTCLSQIGRQDKF